MAFTGFTNEDFDVFNIHGLDERMHAIKNNIQPKFQELGQELVDYLAQQLQNEMFLHIAKHARRTVNPPKDTWLAIANNKRGYKKHPHFQIGLFNDHLFIWLAFIYELPNKQAIAKKLLNHIDEINDSSANDFVVSLDHMKKGATAINQINLHEALHRFKVVKKAEFLIGRNISSEDKLVSNGDQLISLAKDTFDRLLPIYRLSLQAE